MSDAAAPRRFFDPATGGTMVLQPVQPFIFSADVSPRANLEGADDSVGRLGPAE
jgi:hypothetical protein